MRRLALLYLWLIPMMVCAQEFNPENPPEPYTYYKVTVTATPFGYTSGSGMYLSGNVVNVGTSAYSTDYTFSHWNKNGAYYGNTRNFEYTVTGEKVSFEAVYDYTPVDPAEPQSYNKYRLYLTNNMPEACSFNRTSGEKVEADRYVSISAYSSPDYDFLGWYEGSTLISSSLSFNYLMPYSSTTLTARFAYNPVNPDEPTSAGGNIANGLLGDVNGDGVVNLIDAATVISKYLSNDTSALNPAVADMNGDGVINLIDAAAIEVIFIENK